MKTLNNILKQLLQNEIFYTMPKKALQDVVSYKLLKAIEYKEYQEYIADNRLEEYNEINLIN